MGKDCMQCKNWEEETYWRIKFHNFQFCQILSGRFENQLVIPPKFTSNVRDKLTGTVALRGPSTSVWNVGLQAEGDMLLLKEGWNEFVKDNLLEEKDILIFKYDGNLSFDVTIFDNGNFCEREASHFVKKCSHMEIESVKKSSLTEDESGSKRKRSMKKSYNEETNYESLDDDDVVPKFQPTKEARRMASRASSSSRPSSSSRRKRGGRTRRMMRGTIRAPRVELGSRRTMVTEEAKKKALRLGAAAALDDSFMVAIRQSHLTFMSIPSEWLRKRHMDKNLAVELRVGEKKWEVKYFYKGYGGGLTCISKSFFHENSLEEDDVCLFHLVSQKPDGIILDVKIFHVAQEVIQPSDPLANINSNGNGHVTSDDGDNDENV